MNSVVIIVDHLKGEEMTRAAFGPYEPLRGLNVATSIYDELKTKYPNATPDETNPSVLLLENEMEQLYIEVSVHELALRAA